uniref:Uncharacterized protein n=1 Tax=Siphoviridae sp. ctpji4 TaxID=2825676 RepID=A0A8S5PC95_9CAUD|nr:MAG TPA: hypothetical protein [Siphoviridae sp. ctpji4]
MTYNAHRYIIKIVKENNHSPRKGADQEGKNENKFL